MDSTRMLRALDKPQDTSAKVSNVSDYILVYPNPTSGTENFSYNLPCTGEADGLLVVADMTGRSMYRSVVSSGANITTVNTSSWENGVYLYRLTCNNKIVGDLSKPEGSKAPVQHRL
jgi:hypothetical protein